MPHRTKEQKAKIAKRLAVAIFVTSLLTYFVSQVLKENLKELEGSLASAETQFLAGLDQSNISLQILAIQQRLTELKSENETGRKDPHRDFSAVIAQDTIQARQAEAQLDSRLDSVSRLIEKLPAEAVELRARRDRLRQDVEKTDEHINEKLKPKLEHDLGRFMEVKLALIEPLIEEIPVIFLSDDALTVAQGVQRATEKRILVCKWAACILFVAALSLGLYATLTGHRVEATG